MIGHIIINVIDFSISEIFYNTLLQEVGFVEDWKSDEEDSALKSYHHKEQNISLMIRYDKKSTIESFVRNPWLDHLCLKVKSREHVDKIHEIVKTLWSTITRNPQDYPHYTENYYAFYFRDPSWIPLEIAYI